MPAIPGTEQLSPAFREKVTGMASRLGTDPEHLYGVMSFETGGTFAPNVRNQAGSGATGLIQFLPDTAQGLGTTAEQLMQMTPEQQLDVVEKYYTPFKGRIGSLKDAYMAVLSPDAVGKPASTVLFRQGSRAYQQNQGFDPDAKGHITIGDVVAKVGQFLTGGVAHAAGRSALDVEMEREMARAQRGVQDDVTPQYIEDANQRLDGEMAAELAKARPLQPTGAEAIATRTTAREGGTTEPAGIGLGDRLTQDAMQVLGGARDAFVNTFKAVDSFDEWLTTHTEALIPRIPGLETPGAPTLASLIPEVPEATTGEGPLIRSASQFLTAFLPATAAVKALGAVGGITQGLAAGAVTDFLAFDPSKPRMANLINDLAPALRNPFLTWLASKPGDNEALGRFKNALEGLGLGVITQGLFEAGKAMRQAKQLGQDVAGGMQQGLREGAAEATGTDLRAAWRTQRPMTAGAADAVRQVTDEEIAQGLTKASALPDSAIRRPDGELQKMYHGTQTGFTQFEAGRASEEGLYGPGLYFTDNPTIGSGYAAMERTPQTVDDIAKIMQPGQIVRNQSGGQDKVLAFELRNQGASWVARVQGVDTAGHPLPGIEGRPRTTSTPPLLSEANVHAVYLDITNPFDIEARVSPAQAQAIAQMNLDDPISGQEFYQRLVKMAGGKAEANQVLQQAGYDGVTHKAPASLRGDAHTVAIAFSPEQVHPAFGIEAARGTPTTLHVSEATAAKVGSDPSSVLSTGPAAEGISGRILHINFDHIKTGDDVKQTILDVAEVMRTETESQRRGAQTIQETTAKAAASPYREVDRILGIAPGTALNAEDALATRQVWLAASERLHGLSQQLAAGETNVAEEWLKQFVIASNVHVKAMGVQAEAGRALRIFGVDMPSTERRFLDDLAATMTEGGGDVQHMAAQMAQLPTPEQLALLMVKSREVTRADMFSELWYGALLSGPPTHIANMLDGALRTLWAIPERYFMTMTGHPRDIATNFKAANAYTYGLKQGLQEAWGYAGEAFKTGISEFGHSGKIPLLPQPAFTARNLGWEGTMLGGFADFLGSAARLSGRGLLAGDEFFKVLNYRMQLHEGAFRQATEEGLQGAALAQRIVALTQQPTEALMDRASEWAQVQTLGQSLRAEGAPFENLGKFVDKLSGAREDWLPAKIVLPFIKTPFNIVRAGLERTPILGNLSANVNRQLMAGGAEGALARSKMALGGLTMGMFGLMAAENMITGRAPVDPGQKATWERLGIVPYSIWVPGLNRYVSYNRLDIVGLPMGLAADFVTIARESSMQSLEGVAGGVMAALFNSITSKTWLRGVSEVVKAITPGYGEQENVGGRRFEQYIRQVVGSVIPSGVALAARMLDPVQRDTRSLVDTLLDRIPGMGGDIPARLDLWGRPRLRPEPLGPDAVSPFMSREYTADAVDVELYKQGTPVRMPPRTVSISRSETVASEPVDLTPQQYHRLVQLSAGLGPNQTPLKEALRTVMHSPAYTSDVLSDGPRGGKSDLLLSVIQQYQTAGIAQLRGEDPSIERLLERRDIEKALSKTRAGQAQLRTMRPTVGAP